MMSHSNCYAMTTADTEKVLLAFLTPCIPSAVTALTHGVPGAPSLTFLTYTVIKS